MAELQSRRISLLAQKSGPTSWVIRSRPLSAKIVSEEERKSEINTPEPMLLAMISALPLVGEQLRSWCDPVSIVDAR